MQFYTRGVLSGHFYTFCKWGITIYGMQLIDYD